MLHVYLVQNAWSKLRPCSSPSEWHLDGTVQRGWAACSVAWESAWWDGALAPFWRTGWKGWWHSLIHAGHSWQPPGLCPGFFLGGSGQWAPNGRTKAGGCTQIWVTGDQVLGLNQRIKLSNRTDAALLPFPSLKPESPASLQMRPLVLNILQSVWNCSAGKSFFSH